MSEATELFFEARDLLVANREDYAAAYDGFAWPRPTHFNFATDWFDAGLCARHPDTVALSVVEEDGSSTSHTFAELADASKRLAAWLATFGVGRGTRVLVLLGNQVELWEMTLAVMRLGAVIIPATTMLTADDLADRIRRAGAGAVVARRDVAPRVPAAESLVRVAVGGPVEGWLDYEASRAHPDLFEPDGPTPASDPLLLYFTSGTTARPKMVEHSQVSYPIGHLSTMYWIGLREGDVHLNLSSPGWAKHAWSCVFAPWIAGATTVVFNYARFDAAALLDVLVRERVTTFCAPPTVWRMLVLEDLGRWSTSLRELVSAGEPLNPEVIEAVRRAWGLTVRDGYGQTETTLQIVNSPGQVVKTGSMGRPAPGFVIDLVDPVTGEVADDGEICVRLGDARPVGLMTAYHADLGPNDDLNERATAGGRYHTGDIAHRDEDGYITYVGRADDVFKSSDYRISPFELESVLIEHPAVAEAAVVPAPDPVRLSVPKAYVTLVPGYEPSPQLAAEILAFSRERLAPYKRVRRLEFAELPKTISGKIRRVELRAREAGGARPDREYREEGAEG
ncbi:MAG: AMP-dependent synthetase [Actinobacteria bacterium 21-73-9]|nr:MAG: AMP-dependent synthetase [Actinobacteria bacterium 21-73-9]